MNRVFQPSLKSVGIVKKYKLDVFESYLEDRGVNGLRGKASNLFSLRAFLLPSSISDDWTGATEIENIYINDDIMKKINQTYRLEKECNNNIDSIC